MRLNGFQVTNFRSIRDSGWIECDNITTLVGINESGKSNLLLALWKLNPARDGKIDVLHDMPVSMLSSLRDKLDTTPFIRSQFTIDEDSANYISRALNCICQNGTVVDITRFYDEHYAVEFPNGNPRPNIAENVPESNAREEANNSETATSGYTEDELRDAVIHEIPKFIYYSNYGNLSAKIYLPHVIKWLNGQKTPGIEANDDQVRTLRVLFEFVGLDPQEILDLGKDPKVMAMEQSRSQTEPTKEQIKKAEDDKEQRSILLQSASGELTRQFRDWWKQGEYKFRFEADGDYFRIWVSDQIRTDEVGLELRSTGLQWFFSFYLIFLVESQEGHKNAVLLLDEAGLTLHPLAQRDLCCFFDNLAEKNQIINTTHSPFIIDTSNIDRCRVVYTDKQGFTVASSNLREGVGKLGDQSIYAVHAAMGLSVSDILFQGCQTVIVEGPSDQHYLNAIKSYLIHKKLIAPKQEIVFVPSGGVKGVPGVVSLLTGKRSKLPYVLLDSDQIGANAKKKLISGLYKDASECILEVKDFIPIDNSEVEDIIPYSLLKRGIYHLFLTVEDEMFDDLYVDTAAILPQIEQFASTYEVELIDGWKVELAKSAKQTLDSLKAPDIDAKYQDIWVNLFNKLIE